MWEIDGEKSEEHKYAVVDADKDPEKKWNEINITTLGCQPIKVSEGQKI